MNISAPGKLFLLGEYAVLAGAPALLSAVDRRVHVHIEPSDQWQIDAPDIGVHAMTLMPDGRIPDDLEPAMQHRLRVYAAVHQTVTTHVGLSATPLAMRIDSHAFADAGHKLGLGSSAAVSATLTAALAHAAGAAPDTTELCRLAIAAHRLAQNGTGSGADVATSCHGGVIEYQDDAVRQHLAWPEGLTGMAVVTGTGADTTDLVGRVREYGQRQPARHADDMARLAALASRARDALNDPTAFLALTRDYFHALQTLDAGARAGIVLPVHCRLAAIAEQHGGSFKTTGAGGGDLGLAFARSGRPARELANALRANGARIVPLDFAAAGLEKTT